MPLLRQGIGQSTADFIGCYLIQERWARIENLGSLPSGAWCCRFHAFVL
jgi:hypothetical protein